MRITDNRYAGEREYFDLAIRMIRHEARTGTIRACTGFSEDRIRKIYSTYFPPAEGGIRRRRGKTPSQIAPLVSTSRRQAEASLLAVLLLHFRVATLDAAGRAAGIPRLPQLVLGQRFCAAYEAYQALHPAPGLHFEWGWNLYRSLVETRELRIAWCASCTGPYVDDAYALQYDRCPFCETKDIPATLNRPPPAV